MNNETKTQLLNLYAQKGEILTELEIMQGQLQRVNQQIIQARNAAIQEQKTEKSKDKKEWNTYVWNVKKPDQKK